MSEVSAAGSAAYSGNDGKSKPSAGTKHKPKVSDLVHLARPRLCVSRLSPMCYVRFEGIFEILVKNVFF